MKAMKYEDPEYGDGDGLTSDTHQLWMVNRRLEKIIKLLEKLIGE